MQMADHVRRWEKPCRTENQRPAHLLSSMTSPREGLITSSALVAASIPIVHNTTIAGRAIFDEKYILYKQYVLVCVRRAV